MYYRHSQIREKVLPWISESLKSKKDFALWCVRIDPVILSYFNISDDVRYDIEALQEFVVRAATKNRLDVIPESARKNGWVDALIVFAQTLRAKMEPTWRLKRLKTHLLDSGGRCCKLIDWDLCGFYPPSWKGAS
jgi:hypothetical protein